MEPNLFWTTQNLRYSTRPLLVERATVKNLFTQKVSAIRAWGKGGGLFGKKIFDEMFATKFDLESENFDLYFQKATQEMTAMDRAELPKDVIFKLRNNRLGFLGKIYILWKCFRKRWYIVVEDEDRGLSAEAFAELRKSIKKRDYSAPLSDTKLVSTGTFFLANKEFSDTLAYLNMLSSSGSYNFLQRGKNKIPNKTAEWKAQMVYITKFLVRYEGHKKRWGTNMQISMPEFFVMLYLYPGEEVLGSIMYRDIFRSSYNSSPIRIKVAFGTLQSRGYIRKTGEGRGAKLQITSTGTDVINSILTKYALNC